jgi:hypothetical protein
MLGIHVSCLMLTHICRLAVPQQAAMAGLHTHLTSQAKQKEALQQLAIHPTHIPSSSTEEFRPQQLPYHISLSRTVAIRHEQISPLKEALRQQLSGQRRFPCTLAGLRCFCNEDNSTTFISLMVSKGFDQVRGCVQWFDAACALPSCSVSKVACMWSTSHTWCRQHEALASTTRPMLLGLQASMDGTADVVVHRHHLAVPTCRSAS